MQQLSLEKFQEASQVVSQITHETNLVYSEYYSVLSGNEIYFKPENLQYTGSYKLRGAYYKISTLSDEEKQRGLITASAGKLLRGVKLFYIYRGTGIPEGKKSMAFSLELRADDRTLTDADSEGVIAKVLSALSEKLGAVLR